MATILHFILFLRSADAINPTQSTVYPNGYCSTTDGGQNEVTTDACVALPNFSGVYLRAGCVTGAGVNYYIGPSPVCDDDLGDYGQARGSTLCLDISQYTPGTRTSLFIKCPSIATAEVLILAVLGSIMGCFILCGICIFCRGRRKAARTNPDPTYAPYATQGFYTRQEAAGYTFHPQRPAPTAAPPVYMSEVAQKTDTGVTHYPAPIPSTNTAYPTGDFPQHSVHPYPPPPQHNNAQNYLQPQHNNAQNYPPPQHNSEGYPQPQYVAQSYPPLQHIAQSYPPLPPNAQ